MVEIAAVVGSGGTPGNGKVGCSCHAASLTDVLRDGLVHLGQQSLHAVDEADADVVGLHGLLDLQLRLGDKVGAAA